MDRNAIEDTAGQGLTVSSGGAIAGTADLAGGDLTLKSGISTGTGTSAIHFYTATAGVTGTADNTPTEKVTILGAGHVGINQTSPTSKPHVVGTGTYGAAGVSSLNSAAHTVTLSGADPTTYATFYANQLGAMTLTGTNANQTVTDAAGLAVSPAIKSTNVAITNTHGILVPATAVSTATNAYGLTVNAPTGATNNYAAAFVTGNVGIGTTAPGGNLHIKDNSGAGYPEVLVLEAEDASDPGYRFKRESAGTSGDYYVRLRGSPGSTWLSFYSNSGTSRIDEQLNIHSNGNVGLATTAPDARLEINHTTGDVLRLTYNDSDGSATNYTDFSLASDGDLTVDSSGGNINLSDDLAINGGDLTTNQTTFILVVATATTVSFAGAAGTLNIGPGAATATSVNMAGGSGATGCTADGATGNFTCSGDITSTATSGDQGWWNRTGTTLSPINAGDAITTSGNISTSGAGAITSAGLLTGSAGLTASGGTVSLNASSNNAVNINTGTSTGTLTLGGGAAVLAVDTTTLDISAGAITGATGIALASGNFSQVGAGTFSTGTGAVSLNGDTTIAAGKNLALASGAGTLTQAFTGTTTTAAAITANSLTTGKALNLTATTTSAANTAWQAVQFNLTSAQGTTAVSTGSIAGLDLQFTQATSIAGNTETAARIALTQNDSSSTDATVSALLDLANNDTATGNQLTVTDAIKITGANITNGLNLSGTFGTNLITSSNFSVTQAGAVTAVGVNSGSGLIEGAGGVTITGTANINATGAAATNLGNSTGVLTIASGGASGWTNTSGDLTIQTAPSGAMALDSAGILILGTVTPPATNLGKAATTLTVNPTAWTATPTISGLITATSGLTSNGAVTVQNNSNLIMSSGAGLFSQTYAPTTDATADAHTVALSAGGTGQTGALRGLVVNQADTAASGAFDALVYIGNQKTPETTTNGLFIEQNAAAGTLTNGINITNTAGSLTTGLSLTGTFTNYISAPNFSVSNAGAVTAVGVNSGSGLIEGAGGVTITGTANINATGTAATNLGNSTGVLTIASGGASGWTNTSCDLTIQTAASGTMTLDSAGILNLGTVNSTATNLGKAATTLTVNPTAWTATPTISGLITATSGLTSNGAVTVQNNSNLIMSSGTGLFSQTYAPTTDATADAHTVTLSAGGTGQTGALRGLVVNQADTAATGAFDTLVYIGNQKTPETTTNGLRS